MFSLRSLWSGRHSDNERPSAYPAAYRFRPQLEGFEDRTVPHGGADFGPALVGDISPAQIENLINITGVNLTDFQIVDGVLTAAGTVTGTLAGLPFTAVPVFVTRNFHHWAISINAKSDIRTPKDLEGRVVGVNRGYTVTTGLWARGILQSEYGVDLDKVTFVPTDDEHVLGFKAPKNVDYARFRGRNLTELLERQEIDAAIGEMKAGSSDIKQLIPDARNAAYDYFRRTGVYPINHGLVVKNALLKDSPWLADDLLQAFEAAKAIYLKDLQGHASLTSWDKAAADNAKVVGDPFPFGIEANRKTLETMTQFALDQHMIPRRFSVEELFAVN